MKNTKKSIQGTKGIDTTQPKELSQQDKQALDWANANPKDPRAIQIKQKLGL